MNNEKWSEYIKKAKEDYKKIGYVECPALDNAPVYFNKYGWNHLMRKGKNMRDPSDQMNRIKIIPYAVIIIRNIRKLSEYRNNISFDSFAHFWSLRMKVNKSWLRVVIRQMNNGNKHFFSIMYE